MAKEKFWLIFEDQPTTKFFINEPIGYSSVDWNLDQQESGDGRDATLSGGKVPLRFVKQRNHYLEKLLYFDQLLGSESNIMFFVQLETGQIHQGQLDFYGAKTNDFDYFECSVILESQLQVFKRRSETKVDMFSSVGINKEVITPLQPLNMLLKAKPSTQVSEWNQTTDLSGRLSTQDDLFILMNPAQNLVQYGIDDTFTFFKTTSDITTDDLQGSNANIFKVLTAQSSLKNVKISPKNVDINFHTSTASGGNGYVDYKYIVRYGAIFQTSKEIIITFSHNQENQDYLYNGTFPDVIIEELERGDNVWIAHYFRLRQSAVGITPLFRVDYNIKNMSFGITAESTAYNSITPTFRLIDVMKQIAKSIAGLEVYAPRYDFGGEFYDNVITSGKLLGGNINDPFYVSWDDIEKSIRPEHNASSEIQLDGRVFVGIYEDFYTGLECGFFDKTQFSSLERVKNPKYHLVDFKLNFSKYQSLKEATEPNSESTIHGESTITTNDTNSDNHLENKIQWNRDAILLDVQQRLSTKVSKDTATQDDETIFAIDTIITSEDQQFTESTTLQHTYSPTYLSLRSNGEVNFIVLGIKVDTTFTIEYPDSNAGNYNVTSVANTELQLQRISGGAISSANDGIRLTRYTYQIKQETIPLTNRTNEGFTAVTNLISPEKYSNLRYSVQRLVRKYWDRFLATCNLSHADEELTNTYYKNNGKCETEYAGLRVTEKENFIPLDPILTRFMYEGVVFANVDMADVKTLYDNVRTQRGFIRTIDHNKRVLKLYPMKMSYENKSRKLTISGQEKFQKAYLTIVKENSVITINNETKLRKLNYRVEEGNKISLYDLENFLLYNSVYWNKISINNYSPETLEELKSLLDLL